MKKTLSCLTVWVLMFCLLSVPALAMERAGVPQDVQEYAAGQGLVFAKERMSEDPAGFGFSSVEEVARIELGTGFQLHFFDSEKMKNPNGNSLRALAKPVQEWEFILTVDGTPRSFLSVGKADHSYHVISFGGKATEFAEALANFNSLTSKNGAHVQPILIKDRFRYLVGMVNGQEHNIPAVSDKRSALHGNMDNKQLWSSADTIKHLKKSQAETNNNGELLLGGNGGTADSNSSAPNHGNTDLITLTLLAVLLPGTVWFVWHRLRAN